MSLSNDNYNRTVSVQIDVNGYDIYTISNYGTISIPTGSSQTVIYNTINSQPPTNYVPNLEIAIQNQLTTFQAAVDIFINTAYTTDSRLNLLCLYVAAIQQGLTNRAAYIYQLMTWLLAVQSYSVEYTYTIETMTDPSIIVNTSWDFTQISIPDPLVTLAGALAITN